MTDYTYPLFTFFPREYSLKRLVVSSAEEFNRFVASGAHSYNGFFTSLYDCKLNIDKIFWDFDSRRLVDAKKDVQVLTERLRVVGGQPIVVFSGRKGFHVYLPIEVWSPPNLPTAKEVIRMVQLRFAHDLPTLDHHVVGDVRRLVRIPLTKHPEGAHCIYVDYNCYDWKFIEEVPDITSRLDIKDLVSFGSALWRRKANTVPYFGNGIVPSTGISMYRYLKRIVRPCVAKCVCYNKEPPHLVRVDFVCELRELGYTVDEVCKIIEKLDWKDYNRKTTRYQVEQIYRNEYKPLSCQKLREFVECNNCGWWYFW